MVCSGVAGTLWYKANRIVRTNVFQFACSVAMPSALVAGAMKAFENYSSHGDFLGEILAASGTAMYSNISFLIGFLIVFRTSQAYARFWGGCTSVYQFMASWSDGAASLIAFCKASKADQETVLQFQQTLMRLLSLLNALMLTELSQGEGEDAPVSEEEVFPEKRAQPIEFELIDIGGLDLESVRAIEAEDRKIQLVFQWIQCLIVENMASGVLAIPPPILTRCLQQFAGGMEKFEDALKIVKVPLPFPYLAAIEVLLMVHWVISPLIVIGWTSDPFAAAIMCFIQVFFFWSLNATAAELENPFGTDAEDLDTQELQNELNGRLRCIILFAHIPTPQAPELLEAGTPMRVDQVFLPDMNLPPGCVPQPRSQPVFAGSKSPASVAPVSKPAPTPVPDVAAAAAAGKPSAATYPNMRQVSAFEPLARPVGRLLEHRADQNGHLPAGKDETSTPMLRPIKRKAQVKAQEPEAKLGGWPRSPSVEDRAARPAPVDRCAEASSSSQGMSFRGMRSPPNAGLATSRADNALRMQNERQLLENLPPSRLCVLFHGGMPDADRGDRGGRGDRGDRGDQSDRDVEKGYATQQYRFGGAERCSSAPARGSVESCSMTLSVDQFH